jgi:hypothetical protein
VNENYDMNFPGEIGSRHDNLDMDGIRHHDLNRGRNMDSINPGMHPGMNPGLHPGMNPGMHSNFDNDEFDGMRVGDHNEDFGMHGRMMDGMDGMGGMGGPMGAGGRGPMPGMGGMGPGMGGMGPGMGGINRGRHHGHGKQMGGNMGGQSQSNHQTGTQTMSNQQGGWFSNWYFSSFYEIMMLVFLGGFIFNCFCGRKQNDKYATLWYHANQRYFEERYESIGLAKDEDDDAGHDSDEDEDTKKKRLEEKEAKKKELQNSCPLVKEGPTIYKYYAANYRYIKWLFVVLEFRQKADAMSFATGMFFNDNDRIVYEVAIEPLEVVNWVFCVCKKRDARSLKRSYEDLEHFTQGYDPSIMSDRLTLLAENNDLFLELFQNKQLLQYYKVVEDHLDILYYTDHQTFSKEYLCY